MIIGNLYKVRDEYKYGFKKDTFFLLLCQVPHSEDWYIANYNMADQDSWTASTTGVIDYKYPKFPILTKKDVLDMGIYEKNIRGLLT